MKKLLVLFLFSSSLIASLEEYMSPSDQAKMGINKLNVREREALEKWLEEHCGEKKESKTLFLSENIGGGFQIKLTDGSLWEVSPKDRNRSALWITPIQIEVQPNSDPDYPYKLVNVNTKSSLAVRPAATPAETSFSP